MNTTNSTEVHPRARSQPLTVRLPSWLRGRRGLVLLGTLVLGLGLAFNWSWLVAAGVAPLLLSVLPCVAMCALGLCMKRVAGSANKASSIVSEDSAVSGTQEMPRSCCASEHNAVER
uniref:DUF2892 domain-containing protein n=1 Tax=Rhizobium leguminosarum TaxID=384 RepID=A0A179BET0_RHILE|nr:hypothetical protein [Rhizobium leguminosarum]OAP90227.1 hypothetical protein A4U53_30370 [Rhizobium leguminosarum]